MEEKNVLDQHQLKKVAMFMNAQVNYNIMLMERIKFCNIFSVHG